MGTDWYIPNGGYYRYNNNSDWASLPPAVQSVLIGTIILVGLVVLALFILQLVGMIKTFKKAGQKGWAAIVPFYSTFTIIKIAGLELWWFVIFAILPLITSQIAASTSTIGDHTTIIAANISAFCIAVAVLCLQYAINYKIAKSFGKDIGFAIGLTLVAPIFWMILGCSADTKYKGPAGPYQIKYPARKN